MSEGLWNPEQATDAARSVIDNCVAEVTPFLTSNGLPNPFLRLSGRVQVDCDGKVVCSSSDLALLQNLSNGGRYYPPTNCLERIQENLTDEFDSLQL
jgi:hypothetical protein